MTGATTSLSTHVLDLGAGRPLAGVAVSVWPDGAGAPLDAGETDADGRCSGLVVPAVETIELRFVLPEGRGFFFPEPRVRFSPGGRDRMHVPLLVSAHGYSTYLGS